MGVGFPSHRRFYGPRPTTWDKLAALRRRVIQALESRHQPLRQPERSPDAAAFQNFGAKEAGRKMGHVYSNRRVSAQ